MFKSFTYAIRGNELFVVLISQAPVTNM